MLSPTALLSELKTTVEALVDRHLESSKDWFPHTLVPWSRGRDFEPGVDWKPEDSGLPGPVRDALFVNLLTEDNLPHYFETINRVMGSNDAWGTWSKRWTAEEGRHAIVMRDYMTVTRAVDPVALERARMFQVASGAVPQPPDPRDSLSYVALQELATRISHLNTGRLIEDPAGYEIMKRVAGDENRHHLFYRDLTVAALEVDPDATVQAIDRQVRDFAMPGAGIDGFAAMARSIAKAGIYDMKIHLEQILKPVLITHWKLPDLKGLSAVGEQARDSVLNHLDRLTKIVARQASREAATA